MDREAARKLEQAFAEEVHAVLRWIETPRLILRCPGPADVEGFLATIDDEVIGRNGCRPTTSTRSDEPSGRRGGRCRWSLTAVR